MHYQPALAGLGVSLVCLWILLSPPVRRLMLDYPNARSLQRIFMGNAGSVPLGSLWNRPAASAATAGTGPEAVRARLMAWIPEYALAG